MHILNPFDPLVIQRKRLAALRLRAPLRGLRAKEKRVFGYFAQPVLVGDEIVAALDLKTDRERGKLLIQKWTWCARARARARRQKIESRSAVSSAFSSRV